MKANKSLIMLICICCFLCVEVCAQQGNREKVKPDKSSQDKSKSSPQYIASKRSRPAPFSDAVRVGDMLYLSGQLGTDENSKLVEGGVKAETKQIMEKIRRLLEENGSGLDHVVKCTVMLADMNEWAMMNEVYVTYFPKDRLPARSAFATNGLALKARVEIECIAVVK
jgi:reactive intermediate/imine deaminase